MTLWNHPTQTVSSSETSINSSKMAASFKRISWEKGTVNADIGGGKFDNASEHLSSLGVENVIYDPYNRSSSHNEVAVKKIRGGQSDTATVNNVLNVIKESEMRLKVIKQASNAVGCKGVAYFLIYEGDKTGRGRNTKKGWQEHRKAEDYISEIATEFGVIERKGNLIIAKNLKKAFDNQ